MSNIYSNFINENCALPKTKKIGVYLGDVRKGTIEIPNHMLAPNGNKLYSFGAISDIHITNDTAQDDFKKALTYMNDNVNFTCVCGDMTDLSYENEFILYRNIVNECLTKIPIYAIAGNHDRYRNQSNSYFSNYTGYPLFYSLGIASNGQCVASDVSKTPIAYDSNVKDVFIMVGHYRWVDTNAEDSFSNEEIQWLYETLETNRNKRCFVFNHVFPWGGSGNANGLYETNYLIGTKGDVFNNLLSHYKNTILFHGHSHIKFDLQELDKKANYSEILGYRSIHIPSLSVPRDLVGTSLTKVFADSEGYIVDVYENQILLKGRDFVNNKWLPIAIYKIDTTLVNVPAKTFTDSTGTITV